MILINSIKYNTLLYYNNVDFIEDITTNGGTYYWVYYPIIKLTQTIDSIEKKLLEFSTVNLSISEEFQRAKFKVIVNEAGFQKKSNNSIFGLRPEKQKILIDFIASTEENKEFFLNFFRDLCFSRPFYIGKADCLKRRLNKHITGNSNIIKTIKENNLHYGDIWIGYNEIEKPISNEIYNIFEEISQKFLKPGLTERFG